MCRFNGLSQLLLHYTPCWTGWPAHCDNGTDGLLAPIKCVTGDSSVNGMPTIYPGLGVGAAMVKSFYLGVLVHFGAGVFNNLPNFVLM